MLSDDIIKKLQSDKRLQPANGVEVVKQIEAARKAQGAMHDWATVDLEPGGTLSQALPSYQHRAAQIEMARIVGQAIAEGKHANIEAATGTGKSLGYLIPAVRSNEVTVVSTANKALQDQIFKKDIPFIQEHIQPVNAAMLKGRGNYVCLDRLERTLAGETGDPWDKDVVALSKHLTEAGEDTEGDFDSLPLRLAPEVRSRVQADSNDCAWSKCPHFSDCYVVKMRERVKEAQIIVTNHALLLVDAATEAVLPEHTVVVIDEGHALEDYALRARTTEIRRSRVENLLRLKVVRSNTSDNAIQDVEEQYELVWGFLEMMYTRSVNAGGGGVVIDKPLEAGVTLASRVDRIASELEKMKPLNQSEKDQALYEKKVEQARNLAQDLRDIFSYDDKESYVYHIERDDKGVYIARTPLDVADFLQENLYNKRESVIVTSATLATTGKTGEQDFSFFRAATGDTRADTLERVLPTVFDYQRNALLYMPQGMPEPAYAGARASQDERARVEAYEQAMASEMLRLVRASEGRAFLLFSSKRMLNAVYERIVDDIPYPVLRQGEYSSPEMIRQFKAAGNAVLFGLKTFWEGVSVEGDALSLVAIDKLPFAPPTDPVGQRRQLDHKARGGNPFSDMIIPALTIQLKQGVGRLIRSDKDSGVMAILDARLPGKWYGRAILKALPPARRVTRLQDVEAFFQARKAGGQ